MDATQLFRLFVEELGRRQTAAIDRGTDLGFALSEALGDIQSAAEVALHRASAPSPRHPDGWVFGGTFDSNVSVYEIAACALCGATRQVAATGGGMWICNAHTEDQAQAAWLASQSNGST